MTVLQEDRKRVAIFYPWGNLGAFTSLRDAAALFVEQGYAVDFFTQINESYPDPGLDYPGFMLFNRPEASLFFTDTSFPWYVRRFNRGSRPWMWLEMNFFRPMKRLLLINLLRKRHASQPYACFIGMDPEGLISAAPLAKMLNIPLLYWSLELLFSSEITTQEKKQIKNQEITYSKQANFTIVQDPWRGQALIDENGLQLPRMQYVPNAPRGIARRKKSDYLHRCLNIDPGRKIILCAGTIDYWSMGIEIITAANNWPDDFVLVLQSRIRKDSWAGDYGKKIISLADPKKVVISYDPVPQADYRKFVDSADVGLAFYRSQEPQKTTDSTTTGENIRLMGLSSGKIAGYLFSGLPVIVNDAIIGPKELVKSTDCGICVSHPNEIKEALEIIFYCYDWYVENACKCFEQNLELEKHFSPVISQIGKL